MYDERECEKRKKYDKLSVVITCIYPGRHWEQLALTKNGTIIHYFIAMSIFSNVEMRDVKVFSSHFKVRIYNNQNLAVESILLENLFQEYKSFRNYGRYSSERSLHYQNGPFYPLFVQLS